MFKNVSISKKTYRRQPRNAQYTTDKQAMPEAVAVDERTRERLCGRKKQKIVQPLLYSCIIYYDIRVVHKQYDTPNLYNMLYMYLIFTSKIRFIE